jgi:GNAT superfamily N-acetyltransferase
MDIKLIRTNSDHADFIKLVSLLDELLDERDKEAHSYCTPYNQLDKIRQVVLAYHGEEAVGCGAIREYGDRVIEIKRMFVSKTVRNQGVASNILAELEAWARESGYTQSILETGNTLPEAIALYEKNGYRRIPNYDQYAAIVSSICFSKDLLSLV